MDRDTGFYWISEAGAEPEVACWTDGSWWTVGTEEPAPTRLVRVLSERLRPLLRPLLAAA